MGIWLSVWIFEAVGHRRENAQHIQFTFASDRSVLERPDIVVKGSPNVEIFSTMLKRCFAEIRRFQHAQLSCAC